MTVLDRFALDGGRAVVTGAGRGIGEGIAIALAEAGCDLVLTARRLNEIEAVAERIRGLGRRAVAVDGISPMVSSSRSWPIAPPRNWMASRSG